MMRINPQWTLSIDWGDRREIGNPAWQHVLSAIKTLNGSMFSQLSLSSPQIKGRLMVEGGNEQHFLVSFFPDADKDLSYELAHPDATGADIAIVVDSIATEYPASWLTDLDTAVKVTKHFFDTAELPAGSHWEETPGEEADLSGVTSQQI